MPSSNSYNRAHEVLAEDTLEANTTRNGTGNESLLTLKDLLYVLRKRILIVILVAIVLTGTVIGVNLVQTPLYEGVTKIALGQERQTTPGLPWEDVQNVARLTNTISEAVQSRPVAEDAIQQLNLQITPEDFMENLQAQQVSDTQFLEISFRDPSPERAQQVANTVGDIIARDISQLQPSGTIITATVWEQAVTPDDPASPELARNALLALVLGIGLGIGVALLLEYLDDSWRSPEEAEQISGVPTFAIIPEFEAVVVKQKKGN